MIWLGFAIAFLLAAWAANVAMARSRWHATRAARIAALGVLITGVALCAMIALGARSDFVFRGCGDIPRVEWDATANCLDGWFAQVLMTVLGLGMLAASVVIWLRGRAA